MSVEAEGEEGMRANRNREGKGGRETCFFYVYFIIIWFLKGGQIDVFN